MRDSSSLNDETDEDFPEIAIASLNKENTLTDIEKSSLDGTMKHGPLSATISLVNTDEGQRAKDIRVLTTVIKNCFS